MTHLNVAAIFATLCLAFPAGAQEDPIPRALLREALMDLTAQIRPCWLVPRDATTVTLIFELDEDGIPIADRINMADMADSDAEKRSFEAARRAIMRCGLSGFEIPQNVPLNGQRFALTFDATEAD